jgi:hypothetical protein
LAEVAGTITRHPYPAFSEFDRFMVSLVHLKSKKPTRFGEWVRNLLLLVRYADGSPDFRMDVVVLVVVKHMAMAKMFRRTCMKWHYSPDLWAESRILSNGRTGGCPYYCGDQCAWRSRRPWFTAFEKK